jgi:glucose-1-phosphate thymidylyltransferase
MEVKGVVVAEDLRPRVDRFGSARSDALEHVANKPIADHVLDAMQSAGVGEVAVVASAELSGDIRECLATSEHKTGLRLRYIEGETPLDFGDALRLAAPIVGRTPCIVHLATGLLGETLEPMISHLRSGSPDLIVTVHGGEGPDAPLNAATQELLRDEEPLCSGAPLRMGGIWMFGPDAFRCVSAARWEPGREIDLTTLAERILGAGGDFHAIHVASWRRYAGDPLDLLELNRIALDRLDGALPWVNNDGNRIEGRVWIHERASVRESVIIGPAVIGAGARIADSYIGPYTSIGVGARIEGAEIERSIVAAGASIMHVGGRLVASVVGRNARVFTDFSLPRALRLRVGDGTEIALC